MNILIKKTFAVPFSVILRRKYCGVKNHTDQILKTAFGRQERPTWDDFIEFLEERCVPKSRENINILLKKWA